MLASKSEEGESRKSKVENEAGVDRTRGVSRPKLDWRHQRAAEIQHQRHENEQQNHCGLTRATLAQLINPGNGRDQAKNEYVGEQFQSVDGINS